MTCEKCMERYLSLDNHERLPIRVRIHLANCENCMAEIGTMEDAESLMRASVPEVTQDFSPVIMRRIAGLAPERQTIPVGRWILVGIALILSVALVPFGDSYLWVRETWGTGFDIALFIVLGIAIAIYGAIFIGTHMDELCHRFKIPG